MSGLSALSDASGALIRSKSEVGFARPHLTDDLELTANLLELGLEIGVGAGLGGGKAGELFIRSRFEVREPLDRQ